MDDFGRLITAMVTPFNDSGNVDYTQAKKLAVSLLNSGSDGVVISGTTGEAPTLSNNEKIRLFSEVKEAVGNSGKVIAGTGSNNTSESLQVTEFAHDLGINNILLIDPYYNGPSSLEIRREYLEIIAKKFPSVTVIPYIIPGRTGTKLLPQDLAISYSNCPNINTVKEATGDFENAKLTRRLCGDSFSILSGDDDKTVSLIQDSDIKDRQPNPTTTLTVVC